MTGKLERPTLLIGIGLSGAAALLYEIVWTRAITLGVGSTVHAVSIMLAAFMAGLALGGGWGGRLADRQPNLLALFGILELAVGLFGFTLVPVFYKLPNLFVALEPTLGMNPSRIIVMLISGLLMLAPATLLGAAFPIITKRLGEISDNLGITIGNSYAANTLGAVIGALLAGFLLIPTLGLLASSLLAGFVNILLGLWAIYLGKKL